MASVAPVPNPPIADRLRGWAGVIISSLTGALLAAGLTYYFTVQANNRSAIQQQYLLALQNFDQTGSAVNVSVTNLADAVRERRSVDEARRAALGTIANHTGATQAMNAVVGKANMDAYLVGLGRLTELVEATRDVRSAMQASQARFDLMHNRLAIRNEAERNIYR